jgi:hypothetical protein
MLFKLKFCHVEALTENHFVFCKFDNMRIKKNSLKLMNLIFLKFCIAQHQHSIEIVALKKYIKNLQTVC